MRASRWPIEWSIWPVTLECQAFGDRPIAGAISAKTPLDIPCFLSPLCPRIAEAVILRSDDPTGVVAGKVLFEISVACGRLTPTSLVDPITQCGLVDLQTGSVITLCMSGSVCRRPCAMSRRPSGWPWALN